MRIETRKRPRSIECYDITGTMEWLCKRPECFVRYKLEGYDHILLTRWVSNGKISCWLCKRIIGGRKQ